MNCIIMGVYFEYMGMNYEPIVVKKICLKSLGWFQKRDNLKIVSGYRNKYYIKELY